MYIIVLVLSFIALAAGIAAVGLGFSIKEFSLGGTLLIAGTTAFVGGLVMIAVAGAIRELRRIAEALANRPAPRFLRPGEPFDAYGPGAFRPGAGSPRMPVVPPMPPMPAPMPGPAAEASGSAEAELRFAEPAPPNSQAQASTAAEPPTVIEAPETVPLSPDARPQEQPQPEPDTHQATAYEAERDAEAQPAPPAPQAERQRRPPFDAIWPPRDQAPAARGAEEEEAPLRDKDRADEAIPEPPHAVSILKSGVVDGMAYTLYSDGSIEAELPSGTVRFASIAELREHLARTE
jgi:hypothetical protein